ncbi:ComF family protein [Desulfobacter postgatei]|uniref:Putative amidophosphoribosyltransferase n=1 Tax=Desulfobacter postgatei 2ac9 TaxID=879212 RepID=I5B3Y9_9BACT|nr:ComF family protein [Desulfobacter postgatei]EIM64202.1 putative amidophosphoribosyltransferase [Desulfobacter postgatei 2ac9]
MIKKLVKATGAGVCALVFPDKCLGCGKYIKKNADNPLSKCFCHRCLGEVLPVFDHPFCPACGHCFESGPDHLCEACLKTPMVMESVRAAFIYKELIQKALGLFKYQSKLSLARPFERHLFQAFATHFDMNGFHLIVPIPLHVSKAKKRGFNQSYLLVRNFPRLYRDAYGRPAPWCIDIRCLARVRATVSQTGLDHKARKNNLTQAFACPKPDYIQGKNILLVDDVFTTGATCNAAAQTLMNAGAAGVSALVLARA